MTNETCPFDSAEEKAEWEETHFGIEDEDAAYEEDRQQKIDGALERQRKAFDKWVDNYFGPEGKEHIKDMSLLRAAFSYGTLYGLDRAHEIYKGEENE